MSADEATNVESVSGGEAIVRALRDEHVSLVFGIPGTHSLPIYRHLTASGIRHVTPRHEQGGGYAADGYWRTCGKPGVLIATTGPGVINAATAAATAWADSVPMLIVSPSVPTTVEGRDTGHLHESKDQRGAMNSLVAWSYRATSPADAYLAVRKAFHHFETERPRPVHIEVPLDVLGASSPLVPYSTPVKQVLRLYSTEIEQAASLLVASDRVTFVLGGGARRASRSLTELAERVQASVLTTINGKGVVAESHPLSLGSNVRLDPAQKWIANADVVLAVGTELGESDFWAPVPQFEGQLIRVDIDEAQINKNATSTIGIVGDSVAAASSLLRALPFDLNKPRRDLSAIRRAIADAAHVDGGPYAPICQALQECLGDEGCLATDNTMAAYYGAAHLLPLDSPGRFLFPTGYGTLGYGLPAGIGAKLAKPELPVIVLIGDGGLLFTIGELAMASELKLNLPIVVVNDCGYGEIRRQMKSEGIDPIGVDLCAPNLPALAESFGLHGERLSSLEQLKSSLSRALDRDKPSLIEIPWRHQW